MKILALSLFACLFLFATGSVWKSGHFESHPSNSQIRPGPPTASDIQSGLEMILPALGEASSIDAKIDSALESMSSSHANHKTLLEADSDLDDYVHRGVADSERTIQRTRLLIQHLQNQPLAFNGEQGFELNDLLNQLISDQMTIITIVEAQPRYPLTPKHSQKLAKLTQLENEFSENAIKLASARDAAILWFSQYLRSVEGVSTKVDEDASSKTRLAIERMKRELQHAAVDGDDQGSGIHFDCLLVPSSGQNDSAILNGLGENRYACSMEKASSSQQY